MIDTERGQLLGHELRCVIYPIIELGIFMEVATPLGCLALQIPPESFNACHFDSALFRHIPPRRLDVLLQPRRIFLHGKWTTRGNGIPFLNAASRSNLTLHFIQSRIRILCRCSSQK
ncbi:hypothetical protein BQ8482_300037 [Mesorhizobium delmotii]|uniref:Uncharacterized protein n=1 Tax=Mesorhizobium delmotii TaxID=1631247 RepID=A0A2P9AND5_9HYPH|nr:hypothetical protein BQ8482_300037 [Mesorhizobium delmotii]